MNDDERRLLRHFLAALAYRTQKALRGAPAEFGSFSAGDAVRTPAELVRHMTSVLGYAGTLFIGGHYRPEPLPSLQEEIVRFHEMLQTLATHVEHGTLRQGFTAARLLQGLVMLRRLAGMPVPPENFLVAAIDALRLGADQAEPVSPDTEWPEAPPGWSPPSRVVP
jgi:hypothetical protein